VKAVNQLVGLNYLMKVNTADSLSRLNLDLIRHIFQSEIGRQLKIT